MMYSGNAEVLEFSTEGEGCEITVKVSDGSVLKVKTIVTAVIKVGNDPNTGMPVYQVQAANVVKTMKVPKELVKRQGQEAYR